MGPWRRGVRPCSPACQLDPTSARPLLRQRRDRFRLTMLRTELGEESCVGRAPWASRSAAALVLFDLPTALTSAATPEKSRALHCGDGRVLVEDSPHGNPRVRSGRASIWRVPPDPLPAKHLSGLPRPGGHHIETCRVGRTQRQNRTQIASASTRSPMGKGLSDSRPGPGPVHLSSRHRRRTPLVLHPDGDHVSRKRNRDEATSLVPARPFDLRLSDHAGALGRKRHRNLSSPPRTRRRGIRTQSNRRTVRYPTARCQGFQGAISTAMNPSLPTALHNLCLHALARGHPKDVTGSRADLSYTLAVGESEREPYARRSGGSVDYLLLSLGVGALIAATASRETGNWRREHCGANAAPRLPGRGRGLGLP